MNRFEDSGRIGCKDCKQINNNHSHLRIQCLSVQETIFKLLETQTYQPFKRNVPEINIFGFLIIEDVNGLEK